MLDFYSVKNHATLPASRQAGATLPKLAYAISGFFEKKNPMAELY